MRRASLTLLLCALSSFSLAQPSLTGPVDPLAFTQLKDFAAHRSSSNNPDWNSGLEGGRHAVADGKLAATFVYPTGGKQAVEVASRSCMGEGPVQDRPAHGDDHEVSITSRFKQLNRSPKIPLLTTRSI